MMHAQSPTSRVHQAPHSIPEYKRLRAVVRTMAQEIERLDEDNVQLRVAVTIYRELVRRYAGDAPSQ